MSCGNNGERPVSGVQVVKWPSTGPRKASATCNNGRSQRVGRDDSGGRPIFAAGPAGLGGGALQAETRWREHRLRATDSGGRPRRRARPSSTPSLEPSKMVCGVRNLGRWLRCAAYSPI